MNSLYRQIKSDLLRSASKKAAENDARYHKYDGHCSYGIRAPILARILKVYKKEMRELSCKDTLTLANLLYKDQIEETILAGNFVLQTNIHCLGKSQFSFLDRALDYFCSWSTTDDFCIDVLQPILISHRKEVLRLLSQWNNSKNMWKRRASVVAFVRKLGEGGEFTQPALNLCENLIWDREDLVQKGVGWCLKDLMRGEKVKVLNYVKELRERGVPSTITLYAIRDLKGRERLEILKVGSKKKSFRGVIIGKGHLAGKGVYADKDFSKGEVVIHYHLKPLTKKEYRALPKSEKIFTHTHSGQIMLCSEPERYVNHSKTPNTYQDLVKQQDIALRSIKKGEMITTNATKDDD